MAHPAEAVVARNENPNKKKRNFVQPTTWHLKPVFYYLMLVCGG